MREFMVAICIYDEQCCAELRDWVEQFSIGKDIKIQVEIFHNLDEFDVCIRDRRLFDVIFTEVEFPGRLKEGGYCDCGIALGKAVRNYAEYHDVMLEYFTDESEVDWGLFDLQLLNFRFRPLSQRQILSDMEKAYAIMAGRNDFINIKKDGRNIRIALTRACYAVASEKTVKVYFENREEAYVCISLDQFMEQYEKFGFMRCHRSYAVNLEYVTTYKNRKIQLRDNTMIQVGNKYAPNVKNRLLHRYDVKKNYFP